MRSRVHAIAGAAVIVAAVIGGTAGITAASSHKDRTVIRADVMAAVTGAFTGGTNAIRGIPGGGAPWVIGDAELRLRASGRIDIEVEGLVIDPTFPNPAIAGKNPLPFFMVTVSCLTTDANGAAVTMNVNSAQIPVGTDGNFEAKTMVSLPSPCFAPIVFVANGGGGPNSVGAWFASTGA